MALTDDIISQFAKLNKTETISKETTIYGTIVKDNNNNLCVQLNGSSIPTPVTSAVEIGENDIVTVLLKDRKAIVTGNLSSPSVKLTTANRIAQTANEAAESANDAANKANEAAQKANEAAASVGDAHKYATNYLKFDTNGLVVGNLTDETLGYNVLIDADSVDMRYNETVLASYGSNTIYLGKNNRDATIDFCNGITQMTSHEEDSYSVFDINVNGGCALSTIKRYINLSSRFSEGDVDNVSSVNIGSYSEPNIKLLCRKANGYSTAISMAAQAVLPYIGLSCKGENTNGSLLLYADKCSIGTKLNVTGATTLESTLNVSGMTTINNRALIYSTGNQFKIATSTSGVPFFIRNDGSNTYFLLGNAGADSFNSLRPLTITNTNGEMTLGNGALWINQYGNTVIKKNNCGLYGVNTSGGYVHLIGVNSSNASVVAIDSSSIAIGKSGSLTTFGGRIQTNGGIEINTTSPYIDFHYNNSTADYNVRLINNESGKLHCLGHYAPTANDTYQLGYAGKRWKQLYACTSTISTSDRRLKCDFKEFDERYDTLYDLLKPYLFKLINGDSGRSHSGFVSQDVEEALQLAGLTALDFAGFCKDVKQKSVVATPAEYDENGNIISEAFYESVDDLDENGNLQYEYSLRYEEFIALNTDQIQKLKKKNTDLENRIAILEELINNLTA